MTGMTANETMVRGKTAQKRLLILTCWLLVVLLFASLWYAYDASHGIADPFIDYLGWSCYMWGVLTPLALWLARRMPIDAKRWKRHLPLHIAASVLLVVVQLSLEATVEWLRAAGQWPFTAALRREIELLVHYVSIQQRRFGERLRFDLHLDPGVLDYAVPTLILQPLVENAVRHGIGKHKESHIVSLRVALNHDTLCLEISNLTGVLDDPPEQLFSRGVGLSNTRRRLEQLYTQGKAFDIFNLKPRGVCARLSIPAHLLAPDEDRLAAAVAQ